MIGKMIEYLGRGQAIALEHQVHLGLVAHCGPLG
jgi:hypothetical protein